MRNTNTNPGKPTNEPTMYGKITDAKSKMPLPGYRIVVYDYDSPEKLKILTSTVSDADGWYVAVYNTSYYTTQEEEKKEGNPDIVVKVYFPWGELAFEKGPIVDAELQLHLNIEINVKEKPPVIIGLPNPFTDLANDYKTEIEHLKKLNITNTESLANLEKLLPAQMSSKEKTGLRAFALHAGMGHAFKFDKNISLAMVNAGILSREQIATAAPTVLLKGIEKAVKEKIIPQPKDIIPSHIFGWVGYASGMDPTPFSSEMNIKAVLEAGNKIIDRVQKANPRAHMVDLRGRLNYFNRLQSMARVRGLMEAAGVHDLSSLGTFTVSGTRVIHPGYYVAHPKLIISNLGLVSDIIRNRITNASGSYKKTKNINYLHDAMHFVPNPVTDAVILGSVVDFLENGKLIIGKDVTSLTIVTNEIKYSDLNEINYEDSLIPPDPRARISPERAATGNPRNDRNVFSPGNGDTGRDGGPGSNGSNGGAGTDGDARGKAPDVEIFVLTTPEGMPDIKLGGRRGGKGQAGQHGGNGSDGARGREASSGACYCHRGVGHGGNGGNGGDAGNGGPGGAGGSGGNFTIHTLAENIVTLSTTRPFVVNVSGGPGGNGGDAGLKGNNGSGGAPGDDSWPWCDEEPSRVGSNGSDGSNGNNGNNGPDGPDSHFAMQPITLSDWNAVFNQPWIISDQPSSGPAGQAVHLICKNITTDTVVLFNGTQTITPTAIDIVLNTIDFIIPANANGGNNNVQLRLTGVSGPVFSNTVNFRVTPVLTSLSPDNGVPGTALTLTGTGFKSGAQIKFGARTFSATFGSSTRLTLNLPDHENISTAAGDIPVSVVNPDSSESNTINFALTLTIKVRVKAWRVFPDIWVGGGGGWGSPGTGRDDDDVRNIFSGDGSPQSVWADHNIELDFDTNIGVAIFPFDVAESFPREGATLLADDTEVVKAVDGDGNFLHFEPGAVNYYFVSDIDDWNTWAYTFIGSVGRRQEFIIYEDSPTLTDWEESHVAAHEMGHALGLPHACGDDGDETFGRSCDQDSDRDFLMYPSTNFWTDEGNTLTSEEARIARITATPWHNL